MTQKRKAELQRKLSMAPVAKPPSGLADRLKSDIPDFLNTSRDRERLQHSIAFSLRVAASIVVLVASVFLTVQLMSRDEIFPTTDPAPAEPANATPTAAITAAPALKKSLPAAEPPAASAPASQAPRLAEVAPAEAKDERAQSRAPQPERRRVAAAQQVAPAVRRDANAGVREEEDAVAGTVVGGVAVVGADQAAAPIAAAMPAAPPTPVAGRAAAEAITVTSQAPSSKVEKQARFNLGSSTGAKELGRLKEKLARGEAPGSVDVEALVNHFAGSSQNSARTVQLQVEASRAPLAPDATAVIRYTIDTPSDDPGFRLTEANLSIALEKAVIASHRTVGGVRPLEGSTPVLGANQSATGLVELRLEPGTAPQKRVATIILRYVSATGKRERVEAVIRAGDLDVLWAESSRRHKLATLGALWAETLAGTKRPSDLSGAAAELAGEAPGDPLAQELAAAIASSRPRSSAPTGSGR